MRLLTHPQVKFQGFFLPRTLVSCLQDRQRVSVALSGQKTNCCSHSAWLYGMHSKC